MNVTFHQGSTIVVFDETYPSILWHCHMFTETLFLEVSDSEVVCIRQEVFNS